jgi:hypothetical protein
MIKPLSSALFMTNDSLKINPIYEYIGRWCSWKNQKQYKKLCHIGISISSKWLKNNVFTMRNISVKGIFFKKVGWSSKRLITNYYNPDIKTDIRWTEQRLRHSVEYWYPIVLFHIIQTHLQISETVKIVISLI